MGQLRKNGVLVCAYRVFWMKMVLGVVADPRYLDHDLTLVITNKYREVKIYNL
jgi:hypothetical protein